MSYFNINDNVWVRLTDAGRQHHEKSHKAFFGDLVPYTAPLEDENGWSCWQLWVLMRAFGNDMGMSSESLFETQIKLAKTV